jgi:DNA-binding CsgD family transcriptional regulator
LSALSKSADVKRVAEPKCCVRWPSRLIGSQASVKALPPASPQDDDEFSGRQADVLRLLLQGKSNKLICRELALSESTVKTHLQAVFRKLDVNSRTQAVVAAARTGLVGSLTEPVASVLPLGWGRHGRAVRCSSSSALKGLCSTRHTRCRPAPGGPPVPCRPSPPGPGCLG